MIARPDPYIEAIRWIKQAGHLPDRRIATLLGVSRQAIADWKRGKPIRDDHRRKLLTVRDILERAAHARPIPNGLAAWLDTPRGPDARTPAQLIEAGELDRARLYARADPSPGLVPSERVEQPIPEAFRASVERRKMAVPPDSVDDLFERYGEGK